MRLPDHSILSVLGIAAGLFGSLMTFDPALAAPQMAAGWFREVGYVAPTPNRIIACHGYGCSRRTEIMIEPGWFEQVSAVMKQGRSSPASERKALGEAIRIYTRFIAREFGGKPDAPRSPPSLSGLNGQMDCLDETANTTSLLLVLKQEGLLVHHDVERPESRGIFIDGRYPHYTAVIVDTGAHMKWAVDPWAEAPGQRPDLLPLGEWQKAS
jgi:hypothetical protein